MEAAPPAMLNPAPVIVAWAIRTAAVPLLVRVKVWTALEPKGTGPKVKLVAFAASIPESDPGLGLTAGVPAPVNATQPESDSAASNATHSATSVTGVGRFGARVRVSRKFGFVIMQRQCRNHIHIPSTGRPNLSGTAFELSL